MESKIGSVLTLIAGILNYVIAGISLLISIIGSLLINSGLGEINGDISRQAMSVLTFIVFLIIAIIFLLIGFLLHKSSKKMLNKKTVKNGSIWSLVLGIITIGTVSGILALIGGIIGLVDSNK